jgi:hypothetical protein
MVEKLAEIVTQLAGEQADIETLNELLESTTFQPGYQ